MKVLVISGNFLPMSPPGPAYVAGAALAAGHDVEIFDCLVSGEAVPGLSTHLDTFDPDVVALSIPMVTCDIPGKEVDPSRIDTRPILKHIVDTVKRNSRAVMVLGGGGFNYFSADWLEYLELDYGIQGEGEVAFPKVLFRLSREESVSGVANTIVKQGDKVITAPLERIKDLNVIGLPAYHLFDTAFYNRLGIPWGIQTKRGCAFGCSHCPHPFLEGRDYRSKAPSQVVFDIQQVMAMTGSNRIDFCDNSFNCPITHAKSVCREIIDQQVDVRWRSGIFKPLGVSRQFCQLLKESGCAYVGLSIGSASERMLSNMNSRYTIADIRSALDHLSEVGIDMGASLVLGVPGETLASIRESLAVLADYPGMKAVWINIGVFGWGDAQKKPRPGESIRSKGTSLFQGAHYMSPALDSEEMMDVIDSLRLKKNYWVQVNKPWAGYTQPSS